MKHSFTQPVSLVNQCFNKYQITSFGFDSNQIPFRLKHIWCSSSRLLQTSLEQLDVSQLVGKKLIWKGPHVFVEATLHDARFPSFFPKTFPNWRLGSAGWQPLLPPMKSPPGVSMLFCIFRQACFYWTRTADSFDMHSWQFVETSAASESLQ